MESSNAALKGTCFRLGPRTTDTKVGGSRQALFSNTGRQRPGVIAIPAGVASSGLHIYRLPNWSPSASRNKLFCLYNDNDLRQSFTEPKGDRLGHISVELGAEMPKSGMWLCFLFPPLLFLFSCPCTSGLTLVVKESVHL